MRLGSKGEVTIPFAIRKALRITSGSKMIVKLDGGRIIMEKLKSKPVDTFRNISKKGKSINKISYNEYKNEVFKRNKS